MARRYAIADALGEAVERLAGAGLPDPRREARTLWAAVAGAQVKPGDVWLRRDRAAPAAVERSADAAALARENVALVQPPVPVEVREGDLLAPLAGERYRAIVSNPPYLTAAEHAALDPAVRLFEPREALVSGADGLTATR